MGTVGEIDERADVYGLGAILFLLLTDGIPDADRGGTLRVAGVPRPLAAICARALAGEPSERYQTVTALADDVARYATIGRSRRIGRPSSTGSADSAARIERPSCSCWRTSSCAPRWPFSPAGNADHGSRGSRGTGPPITRVSTGPPITRINGTPITRINGRPHADQKKNPASRLPWVEIRVIRVPWLNQ